MPVGESCVRLSSIPRLTRRGRGARGARYRSYRRTCSGLPATVAGRRWHGPNISPPSAGPNRSPFTSIKPWYSRTWGWSALRARPNDGALLWHARSEPVHASRSPARSTARFASDPAQVGATAVGVMQVCQAFDHDRAYDRELGGFLLGRRRCDGRAERPDLRRSRQRLGLLVEVLRYQPVSERSGQRRTLVAGTGTLERLHVRARRSGRSTRRAILTVTDLFDAQTPRSSNGQAYVMAPSRVQSSSPGAASSWADHS